KPGRQQRLELIAILGDIKQPAAMPVLLSIVETATDPELCRTALAALLPFDDPSIAARVIARHNTLPAEARGVAQDLLSSRKSWTRMFLQAVDSGKIDRATVPLELIRKITVHRDDRIAELVQKHWGKLQGATTAQMQKQIDRLSTVIA